MSQGTLDAMVCWVDRHIEERPRLEALAEYVGYSAYYCSAKFHEYVGMSYQTYVLRRKLTLAAEYLRQTDQRILDIALRYGFSSHESFTRAFRKVYGCTPREYRQSLMES